MPPALPVRLFPAADPAPPLPCGSSTFPALPLPCPGCAGSTPFYRLCAFPLPVPSYPLRLLFALCLWLLLNLLCILYHRNRMITTNRKQAETAQSRINPGLLPIKKGRQLSCCRPPFLCFLPVAACRIRAGQNDAVTFSYLQTMPGLPALILQRDFRCSLQASASQSRYILLPRRFLPGLPAFRPPCSRRIPLSMT